MNLLAVVSLCSVAQAGIILYFYRRLRWFREELALERGHSDSIREDNRRRLERIGWLEGLLAEANLARLKDAALKDRLRTNVAVYARAAVAGFFGDERGFSDMRTGVARPRAVEAVRRRIEEELR